MVIRMDQKVASKEKPGLCWVVTFLWFLVYLRYVLWVRRDDSILVAFGAHHCPFIHACGALQTITCPLLDLPQPSVSATCEAGRCALPRISEKKGKDFPKVPRAGQELDQESNPHHPRPFMLPPLVGPALIFTIPGQEYTWRATHYHHF